MSWNEIFWSLGYVGPVASALCIGAVVLWLNRRKAPRAALIGAGTLLGVLVLNGLLWFRSEMLVYDMRNGSTVAYFVWQLQILSIASALLHSAAVGLLVWAILTGRGRPGAPPPPTEDE
jgi:hypothetical protein